MNAGLFLVDTHALLWALGEPSKLSSRAAALIGDEENRLLVSVATLWELSIKQNVGKLELPEGFFDDLFGLGYERLAISDAHLTAYRALPLHHRDPFDRLLIAQAQVESMPILTCDPKVAEYDVDVIW